MNDITRASRSTPDQERRQTLPTPTSLTGRRTVVDPLEIDEDSRWLYRLASAVTAALTVASPRTAFLASATLGPRHLQSTSASSASPDPAAENGTDRDRGIDP